MYNQTIFPWKRYWVARDGTISLGLDGFPADPEIDSKGLIKSSLLTYQAISGIPCLALLGEPGIGKSRALVEIRDIQGEMLRQRGDELLYLDLRSYASEDRLYRAIFESPEFQKWINGTHALELLLDSLDECLVHNRAVAAMIVDELRKYPRSRMRLRIACRTGAWPSLLSRELPHLWEPTAYAEYELAPLLWRDVRLALEANNVHADQFASALRQSKTIALAQKPLTLKFLIESWDGTSFPSEATALYERGCRQLCIVEKSSPADQLTQLVTTDQALAIGERIAATMIYGKKSNITFGMATNVDELSLTDVAGGSETANAGNFSISLQQLIFVIQGTGLFSGRSEGRMGWSHWSFAEFLAAKYLVSHSFGIEQIRSLVMQPDPIFPKVQRVVPQLRETVAWLCALVPSFISELVIGDPEILLRSVGISINLDIRRKLVDSMLKQAEQGRRRLFEWFSRNDYSLLKHAQIADQLLPYISASESDLWAREMAFEIAEGCQVVELLPQAIRVAGDDDEVRRIRRAAAHFVARTDATSYSTQLKSLLHLPNTQDPDDELKGVALRALWPNHLEAKELFKLITKQRQANFVGSYVSFLHLDLKATLRSDDLTIALQWAASQPSDHEMPFAFLGLVNQIIQLACNNLEPVMHFCHNQRYFVDEQEAIPH